MNFLIRFERRHATDPDEIDANIFRSVDNLNYKRSTNKSRNITKCVSFYRLNYRETDSETRCTTFPNISLFDYGSTFMFIKFRKRFEYVYCCRKIRYVKCKKQTRENSRFSDRDPRKLAELYVIGDSSEK